MQTDLKNGDIFLVYLIVYPVGRFLLDFLRLDASLVGEININQTVMAVVALCSALTLYLRHRKVETLLNSDKIFGVTVVLLTLGLFGLLYRYPCNVSSPQSSCTQEEK